ncbi:MAG: ABC transporter ATP-binding protein, partial [Verrucomicrobiota bacterium]
KMRAFAKAEIDRRVQEAATVFGLDDVLERRPDALSAEERLRAALARAAVRQPKVILLDDPLLDFSGSSRAQAQAEITRIHQRLQTTMIYAASDQSIAMSMADSVAIMNNGRVQQRDTPARLYQQPANSFVAGFLGNPPMNLVRGTLRQQGESVIFQEADGGSLRARFPSGVPINLKDSSGGPVILGIRPEEIELSDTQQPSKTDENFPALVDLVEPMGLETLLHLQTGAHTLVSRIRRSLARGDAGQRRRFVLRLERVRLFDPETTVAVT